MTHVQQFDSFDEALDAIAAARDAANATLAEEQKSLTWGSYFANFTTLPTADCVVFGQTFTRQEVIDSEREAGADAAEAEYTANHVGAGLENGYLYARCYSVIEPDGELGDTHRASAWPISKELFKAAESVGWDVWRLPEGDAQTEFAQATVAFLHHEYERLTRQIVTESGE